MSKKSLHGGAGDAAVARNAGDIHGLAMLERGNRQEAREPLKVSDQSFGPNLFAEV